MLQEELRENEGRHQNYMNQMDHEYSLLEQKLQNLETQMKEKDAQLNKEQSSSAEQIEKQLTKFADERKEMMTKVDALTLQLSHKEREVVTLSNKYDHIDEETSKKLEELVSEKSEFETTANKTIEDQRKKINDLNDELVQAGLSYNYEQALLKQKIEFKDTQIQEF